MSDSSEICIWQICIILWLANSHFHRAMLRIVVLLFRNFARCLSVCSSVHHRLLLCQNGSTCTIFIINKSISYPIPVARGTPPPHTHPSTPATPFRKSRIRHCIRKLVYDFLFAFHSNYASILHHFRDKAIFFMLPAVVGRGTSKN